MQTEIVGLVISFGKAARHDRRGGLPELSNRWEAAPRPRSAYFEGMFGFDVKTGSAYVKA
jgi:hypothetical protein